MLKDITSVEHIGNYKLCITFDDGVKGIIDVAAMINFKGVFAPLANPDYFAKVAVNPEIGTICWPNDAALDPDVLYSMLTGETLLTIEYA